MTAPQVISSMATRRVADLAAGYESARVAQGRWSRLAAWMPRAPVRAGEPFDAVVLASDAIDMLSGRACRRGQPSSTSFARDRGAVRAGASHPDIREDAVSARCDRQKA
jgi:molybdate transport system substrate-binding protein